MNLKGKLLPLALTAGLQSCAFNVGGGLPPLGYQQLVLQVKNRTPEILRFRIHDGNGQGRYTGRATTGTSCLKLDYRGESTISITFDLHGRKYSTNKFHPRHSRSGVWEIEVTNFMFSDIVSVRPGDSCK